MMKKRDREEQRHMMMLKQQHKLLSKGGEVMLAYSLNKGIKDIENLR